MPTISAKIIKHPRTQRACDKCGKPITGRTARLFGSGCEGDPPYVMYLHVDCVTGKDTLRKLQAAQHQVAADTGYTCPDCGSESLVEHRWHCPRSA